MPDVNIASCNNLAQKFEVCANEFKAKFTRYQSNPSLENMAEVALHFGDCIRTLQNLATQLNIPLDRILDRFMLYGNNNKNLKLQLDVWEILNQAKAEQEFEEKKLGGSNWKAYQVYKNLGGGSDSKFESK